MSEFEPKVVSSGTLDPERSLPDDEFEDPFIPKKDSQEINRNFSQRHEYRASGSMQPDENWMAE